MYKGSGGTIDFKSQIAHVDICTYCLPVFFCVSPVSEGVITGCYLAAQYPITPSSLAPPSVGETTYPITLHSPSTSGADPVTRPTAGFGLEAACSSALARRGRDKVFSRNPSLGDVGHSWGLGGWPAPVPAGGLGCSEQQCWKSDKVRTWAYLRSGGSGLGGV